MNCRLMGAVRFCLEMHGLGSKQVVDDGYVMMCTSGQGGVHKLREGTVRWWLL